MNLSFTEIDNLNFNDDLEDVEDVGAFDDRGRFTATAPKQQVPAALGSRVPQPRITTMAHKNRGSLAQNITTPAARTVTYDDILSSLNMKVVDGKLQIVRNHAAENIRTNNFVQPANQPINQTKKIIQPLQNQFQQQPFINQKQQNTTFNYAAPQQNVPIMTKEQYKQMVAVNYLKALQDQQRIRNMKSTKLMFSNSNTSVPAVASQTGGNGLNRLFRINGK
jgi:hypothetical protein